MRFGILVLSIIIVCGFIFWKDIKSVGVKGVNTISKDKEASEQTPQGEVQIISEWTLPDELREISGIAYMDSERFAGVQDEKGTIFIYNILKKEIERQIDFGAAGDYEDIAIVGNTAWIVRADGRLFEVSLNEKPKTSEYKTSLTVEHNVEGLAYDSEANRLLLAIKDEEPGNSDYKGIYEFNLKTRKFNSTPVWKIDVNDPMLQSTDKKKKKEIKPSAIAIHPQTKDIYIADGPKSMLAVMGQDGKIKKWISLGKKFNQPEGLAFDPEGGLHVSNEGGKGSGNLMKVRTL